MQIHRVVRRVLCHPDYAPRPTGWEEGDRRGVGSEDGSGWAVASVGPRDVW
jgi:hypothetical protein